MTAPFDPTPRPALRKAADSDVHPTTHASSLSSSSTGDSVLGGKEVELAIRLPKKLRKELKKAARDGGLSIDQLATIALAAEVRRRNN